MSQLLCECENSSLVLSVIFPRDAGAIPRRKIPHTTRSKRLPCAALQTLSSHRPTRLAASREHFSRGLHRPMASFNSYADGDRGLIHLLHRRRTRSGWSYIYYGNPQRPTMYRSAYRHTFARSSSLACAIARGATNVCATYWQSLASTRLLHT